MELAWLAAVSGFALVMAATPGPNNTMMVASGATYGFRRSLPFISGVALGVAIIILVAGIAGSTLVADPRAWSVLKYAGLVYVTWLAWRIGTAPPMVANTGNEKPRAGKPPSLMQGALLQLVNPKLWAMVAGAVATYNGAANSQDALAVGTTFAIIFGAATFASTAAWTLIGVRAARFISTRRTMRLFNWAMAGLLLVSVIPILTE